MSDQPISPPSGMEMPTRKRYMDYRVEDTFILDGKEVPFEPGQTIVNAALAAGHYIPHLCHNPEFKPFGSCKVCTVKVNGWPMASCTTPAAKAARVENNVPEINEARQKIVQMLFIEGNHFCPFCVKSGNCSLQAIAYHLGMEDTYFPHRFPSRDIDASHPDVILDRDRCINCSLCIRASRDVDDKEVFGLSGRGVTTYLAINSPTGLLKDTNIDINDRAMQVCPTGALMAKRRGYEQPIGERRFDQQGIQCEWESTY